MTKIDLTDACYSVPFAMIKQKYLFLNSKSNGISMFGFQIG